MWMTLSCTTSSKNSRYKWETWTKTHLHLKRAHQGLSNSSNESFDYDWQERSWIARIFFPCSKGAFSLHSLYMGWQATYSRGWLNWEYHNTWSPYTQFSGNKNFLVKSSIQFALKLSCLWEYRSINLLLQFLRAPQILGNSLLKRNYIHSFWPAQPCC